ncbi:MAG: hypothetical protein ACRDFR_07465 [Candidatus Limnocylindria bacterium]
MPRFRHVVASVAVAGTLACLPLSVAAQSGPMMTGGGHFLFAGEVDVQFSFSAVQHPDGSASGAFHHSFVFDGHRVDYWGQVTCLAVDPVTSRAWLGGFLTKVTSTHPDVIELPGDDAWFRVLDTGSPSAADPDRSTFMGFKNEIIDTSEQYCAMRIWPDGDARTHPVTQGNLSVSP